MLGEAIVFTLNVVTDYVTSIEEIDHPRERMVYWEVCGRAWEEGTESERDMGLTCVAAFILT